MSLLRRNRRMVTRIATRGSTSKYKIMDRKSPVSTIQYRRKTTRTVRPTTPCASLPQSHQQVPPSSPLWGTSCGSNWKIVDVRFTDSPGGRRLRRRVCRTPSLRRRCPAQKRQAVLWCRILGRLRTTRKRTTEAEVGVLAGLRSG